MVMGVASYNVELLWIESVTFSKMTKLQGDEIWLLVGSGTGFQTYSMISLERTVYNMYMYVCFGQYKFKLQSPD